MKKIFIKPASPSTIVRDPDDIDPVTNKPRPLRNVGEYKIDKPYWRRRLIDGDVVRATPPQAQAAKGQGAKATRNNKNTSLSTAH